METNNIQIKRITEYENMLDEATELLAAGMKSERLTELVQALEAYYTGGQWKRDFADDEEGKLPRDLKRGVLSEDGIYDLLEAYGDLTEDREGPVLETERLILRPWTEDDAEECFKYAADPLVGPACGWPPHKTVEESGEVIRDILMVPETYAIVLKETGLPIGSISFHFHSFLAKEDDEAEMGFWLGVPYWGRGFVPEAAREMLRHGFEDLGLAKVWCGYFDGNFKSERVQRKLGFKHISINEEAPVPQMGETRKGYANCLTREDWLECNQK